MRRPKVLLIKSRSVVSKLKSSSPPLGLLYIAAALRRDLGAEVRVLDALMEPDIPGLAAAEARSFGPDVVGISALTAEAFLAHKLAAAVKESAPGVPVIIGGPYATSDPAEALADGVIDAAVIGEGEATFAELVRLIMSEGRRWNAPGAADGVAGLALPSEGGVKYTPPRPPIEDLDSLPFPAWDLIDYKKFWRIGSMASVGVRPYLPIFTSRGCPYRCVYCHQIFGKKFRPRSPESVAEEIAVIHRLGTRDIEVFDDISNMDPDRFDRIMETMLERGLESRLSFPNGIRGDLLRESSADLLKRVGTGEISIAVETASERLQKLLNKNISLPGVTRAINMLADRRVFTRGFFMLGLPTETEAEMRETIRYARRSRLHMALFFNPNPYAGTEFREMFRRAGRLPDGVSTIDFEYFGAPFNGSEVPDAAYRRLYWLAYYGFYLDPARGWRIARDGPFGWDIPVRAWNLFRTYMSFRRLKESL